ncbi:hypothetical protein GGI24_003052 [Coemansia furcata]|nr:hypothetical protein GGI24_003052 [Coemansia furcata]
MPSGDGSATVLDKDVGTLRAEIEASQRTIQGLQSNIATIKAQADMERVRLQEEISALRAQRKEEESSQAAQRETIRHLEAEKRHLESERMRLDKDIANALAKRQRAQDSIREQGRQADTYLRNAKSIEANMEKQRQDHHQQQTELQATIASLKEEVDKAKQNLESLTSQHTELASSLRTKRMALAVQEKKNAELDLKVKEALQKKRQMKESQAEIVKSTARMQAEIDVLTPQLEQVIRERRRLEMSAKMPTSATFPPPGFSTALSHPSIYGIGGDIGAADLELSSALSYPVSSIPAPASQSVGPGTSHKTNNGTRHVRSSSFATSPINAPRTVHASSAYKPAAQRNAPNGGQAGESIRPTSSLVQIGYPHGIATASASTSRRSADFDIFGYLDRDSPRVASAKGDNSLAATGLLPPLRMNSRDIDSTSLRYVSNGSGGYTHSMPSTSMAIFTGTSNIENGEYAPRLSSMAFWGEPVVSPSSLSSTTAEASALSILKDTDLAYPTPERHSFRTVGQYGEPRSHRQEFRTPPPSAPALPSGLAHQSLNRMLSSSMEGLVDPHHHQHHHGGIASTSGGAPHSRFGSIDLRAGSAGSGGGWPEFDFSGNGDGWESGRSSTVNDRHTSPCADMNSFSLLRSATPVEPQPLRLSGDMLAVHRPHVEPIGAPIRRRPVGGGSPSPNDVNVPPSRQLSHPPSHPPVPPPAPIQFPPGFQMRREMSHPSSFGHSLYHKRSLWDHQEASAESSSPAQNVADMALESGNAPHGAG